MSDGNSPGVHPSPLVIDAGPCDLRAVMEFVFHSPRRRGLIVAPGCVESVSASHRGMLDLMNRVIPIYGVTTGFGDSSFRLIRPERSGDLQRNLVSYLLCGTGALLPRDVCRATLLFRLQSLTRGLSGVSPELIERLRIFLERDWIPAIPREGSLGASGDLIPLAYIAQAIQGEGHVFDPDADGETALVPTAELLARAGLSPYALKPKEGLALVNGTSVMAGLALVNLREAQFLTDLACLTSAWLCLVLQGRTEAFEPLVNERASRHPGQARIARSILALLREERYVPVPLDQLRIHGSETKDFVQDRYSLRCTPQILGPVTETVEQGFRWLQDEVNGASDNPLIDPVTEGSPRLAMGGNFYGGYLAQGMDYLKVALAHNADLMDRQLMCLIDEKSNRGLPPNLAAWNRMPADERALHHGLKGLHQAVSALTSEVMAKAIPNSIFSRSSESHNQDKVSLGMSAGVQCHDQLDQLFTIAAIYLICLAQALDLREVSVVGRLSRQYYELVRSAVPFIERDQPLEQPVRAMAARLRALAKQDPGAAAAVE